MKEHPILFSAPMARAILEGRKTVTRRAVKSTALDWLVNAKFTPTYVALPENGLCPYGYPGNQLWVRETFAEFGDSTIAYRSTDSYRPFNQSPELPLREQPMHWSPSIHMPRWASRINLEVTAARIERLHDITSEQILAEGVRLPTCPETGNMLLDVSTKYGPAHFLGDKPMDRMHDSYALLRAHWAALWVQINGIKSWEANPWVWAIEFQRLASA